MATLREAIGSGERMGGSRGVGALRVFRQPAVPCCGELIPCWPRRIPCCGRMDSLFGRAGNLGLVISQNTEFADVFEMVFTAGRPIFEKIRCCFPVSLAADRPWPRVAPAARFVDNAEAASMLGMRRYEDGSRLNSGRVAPL
jgi:hypothetical protein